MLVLLYLNLFTVHIRPKKCGIKLMIIITILKFCHDRYKTQEICDKIVYGFLLGLKFVPDWFFTNKTTKKLYTPLFADDGILF